MEEGGRIGEAGEDLGDVDLLNRSLDVLAELEEFAEVTLLLLLVC